MLAALLLAGAGTVAAPTSAAELVSNVGQADDTDSSSSIDRAQRFTTGPNSTGYTVTSVEVDSGDSKSFSVSICGVNSSNRPTSTCTALSAPDSFSDGLLTFTAPAGTTLRASTTYAVVFADYSSKSLDGTTSDNEDSTGASGWSIANTAMWKTSSGWQDRNTNIAFRIRINGSARAADADTTATQSGNGANWSLVGPGTVVPGGIYHYTLTRTSGDKPHNEYFGLHSRTHGESRTKWGTSECTGSHYFCFTFSNNDSGYQEFTVSSVHFAGRTVSSTSPHRMTLKVASTVPDATTINLGVVRNDGVPRANPLEITVSASTNAAPTASNNTVETKEDTAYTFAASDFNFSDTDSSDALESVKIVTVETAGDLELDGTDVTANQEVTKAELEDDKLIFTPATDASGTPYATFTFKVNDGEDDSASAYTMTVDVDSVPDVTRVAVTSTPTSGTTTPKKYGDGEKIQVTVTFDEAVTVTGDPEFEIKLGNAGQGVAKKAAYVSGSGTTELVFEYTVQSVDRDDNGIWIEADALDLDSNDKIEGGDNDTADVTFAAPGGQSDHKVDGSLTPPAVSGPQVDSAAVNGTELVITFDETLAPAANLANDAFTVKVTPPGGTEAEVALAGAPAISARTVTLTLATAVTRADTVTVSYTRPGSGTDNKLKDSDGEETGDFADEAVTNNTPPALVFENFLGEAITSVELYEGATIGAYRVRLDAQPPAAVTVSVASGDTSAVTVRNDTRTLTFTTENWNRSQRVVLTGVEDADGVSETVTITHSGAGVATARSA